ncbi:MAG TPA: radical SAM protein [Accumulibacter sp.]|uniref:radical SAM protein n=1 Tax=Accumulibacter sp. TaxID=2053492 RepID=UPI002CAA54B0|nr:radical SAM protein [Accumulibacter sp.]HMW64439.1 radical SAM protein [Accumulibacter sp.]
MGGVVAGSAILAPQVPGFLHTVTLTINNQCNLACPHCYLRYQGSEDEITEEILAHIWDSSFKHLAIVGMEPLLNRGSAGLVGSIASRARRSGKTTSIITNGINLNLLSGEALDHLSFIDVSLDGGERSYEQYRKGSLPKLRSGLAYLRRTGFRSVNALEVLNDVTKAYVDDMMAFATEEGFATVLFSPFVPTISAHKYRIRVLPVAEALDVLGASRAFMDSANAQLLIDTYHCFFEGITLDQAVAAARARGMEHRVRFVTTDPTRLGVMRLTYDGLVLSSFDALNTATYGLYGVPVGAFPSLEAHYRHAVDHFGYAAAA